MSAFQSRNPSHFESINKGMSQYKDRTDYSASKDQIDFGGFGSNDISVLQRTMDMLENQKSDDGLGKRMNIAEGSYNINSLAKPKPFGNSKYLDKSRSHRLSNSQYVPKLVKEIEKQRKGVKHQIRNG